MKIKSSVIVPATIWSPSSLPLRLVRVLSPSLSAYFLKITSPLRRLLDIIFCIWIDVPLILRGSHFLSSPISSVSSTHLSQVSDDDNWQIYRKKGFIGGFCDDWEKTRINFFFFFWDFMGLCLRFREHDESFDFWFVRTVLHCD